MNTKLPTQLNTYIKNFVYTGQQNDIEQMIFAIENLISRNTVIATISNGRTHVLPFELQTFTFTVKF